MERFGKDAGWGFTRNATLWGGCDEDHRQRPKLLQDDGDRAGAKPLSEPNVGRN